MPSINLRLSDTELVLLRDWAHDSRRSLQKEIVFRLFSGLTERDEEEPQVQEEARAPLKVPTPSRSVSSRKHTGLTERGARGVAQQPGQDYRLRHEVTESTGLEPRRTENAGVIAPPAGPGTAAQVDAPRSASPVTDSGKSIVDLDWLARRAEKKK